MKKIIRLTESDLTRIVRRILKETKEDESQYHRLRQGADPGIQEFLEDPTDEQTADELQSQLNKDKFAKGPDFLRDTNLGKGTGKMFIFFNNVKMTPTEFIDQVQEDADEGYCHTINSYEYNNRVLASTKITIKTTTGDCKKTTSKPNEVKKTTPKKACKHSKNIKLDNVRAFQSGCIRRGKYYAEYTDGSTSKCSKVDGVIGCCTATCYAKSDTRM
jgi:hypothetical protein